MKNVVIAAALAPAFVAILGAVTVSKASPETAATGSEPRRVGSAQTAQESGPQPSIAYVANERCVGCHGGVAERWTTSHHFKAMAVASKETVLGDFDDAELTHAGVTSRFSERDGKFFVRTDGPDGRLVDFEIAYTFGVEPIQQYLIELGRGRIQSLTIAWDTVRKRWFHLFPNETAPPGDVLHWTGRYQNWNAACAACHTTNLKKGYDPETDGYATTWSEINVSCQSCHGPGERHVAWAESRSEPQGRKGDDAGLVVDFSGGGFDREIETCAPCHARRSELDPVPVPGEPLFDNYLPALLAPGLYHPDGQQLDEVYVYGSYRQSKMYRAGVRCTECHDPHTARLVADGNALCVRCHQLEPDTERFPGLRAKAYDSHAHHFHEQGSPGAQCVSCHMPEKTYMIVDPRRDHGFRIPRPDLSSKLGTPDACSSCHADRGATWAADAIARRYGPHREPSRHFGEILAAGRAGRADAEDQLASLARDAAQPAIVRATALDLLTSYGPRSVAASVDATRDPDPAVRLAAVASLERVAAGERVSLVAPLLRDPLRAVRIEAARLLSSSPPQAFDDSQRRAFEAAFGELVAAQTVSLDAPGAHLNLAVVYANRGDAERAERHYRKALELDGDFTPARLNLARVLNARGRNADAVGLLEEGIARVPDDGEMHYSLGLLLAEERRLSDAARELGKAADLMPERARVRYNLALALQQLGRFSEAETALTRAQALDPADPAILYALTTLYAQKGDWAGALVWAERLSAVVPGDPRVEALKNDLRTRSAQP